MRRLATRLACRAIRACRRCRAGRPPTCRYMPSCSAYALEALQKHGPVRGAWLTAGRLVRCHPWGSMGLDPVPDVRRVAAVTGETSDV
jgi:putative membrane protein insertion efficiency factor